MPPMSPPVPLVVHEAEIRALVTEADALTSARAAFTALGEDGVQQPPPMGYVFPGDPVEVHVKGAHLAGQETMAVKMASGGYKNLSHGAGPTGSGLVLIVDTRTGYPRAILLENGYLTDLRTAAAGALAASLLCAPAPLTAHRPTMAILGVGVQAQLHARSVTAAMPGRFEKIVLWGRDGGKATAAAEAMRDMLGVAIEVEVGATVAAAVAEAELVITVTPSDSPILEGEWLLDCATVVCVGSDGEGKREIADSVLERAATAVVDVQSQCARLGELQYPAAASLLEAAVPLSDIVLGRHAGRSAGEMIVCDLTGCGAQDAAIGAVVWGKLNQAKL
jgi:ornithine cyclodeaminase/alanine dehydrogenase-like protein (mu-crystallin family)